MSEVRLNQPDATRQPKQNNRTIFYIILIVLLVGINIYLYVKYYQKDTLSQQLTEQVNADSIRIDDLEKKYNEALVSIESYKGQNALLDSIISEKEKELMKYQANLDQIKKQKKLSEDEFKKQVSVLNSVISDLENQIAMLQETNQILVQRNDSLGQSLAAQITTNTQLQSSNQALSKKVNIGSLLKPTSLTATGTFDKNSGKEKETSNAKKAEELKVCMVLPVNDIAEAGEKFFFVRIIDPSGVTINVPSNGSGILKMAENGEERPYTTSVAADYDKLPKTVCAYWKKTTAFAEGKYSVEVYQDGYLIGGTMFELK